MYELMKPERSVHQRLDAGERELALPTNDRLLDVALHGVDSVRQELNQNQPVVAVNNSQPAQTAVSTDEEININILDVPAEPDFDISFLNEDISEVLSDAQLETSYADKLDNVSVKINRIFSAIVTDLFSDDDLLPRLRRLFWLEATKAERDFNTHLVKPMLRQHDRNLQDPELRSAMEVDLESVSDLEELMRVWEGLHRLENQVAV